MTTRIIQMGRAKFLKLFGSLPSKDNRTATRSVEVEAVYRKKGGRLEGVRIHGDEKYVERVRLLIVSSN